jgi:D-lactate dehydrogenase
MFRKLYTNSRRHLRHAATLAQAGNENASGAYSMKAVAAVGAAGTLVGSAIGGDRLPQLLHAPPKTTCSVQLTAAQKALPEKLKGIVGSGSVKEKHLQKGSRLGQGTSLAYVKPKTMQQAIDVLQECVSADVAIVPQGANSGLTGGSVPRDAQDRPTVVINLRALDKMLPIGKEGKQVLCFSGAGIFDLKEKMMKEYNRDSHSVLGSLFLNPSVGAGVAFGSGGTQIRKGPSWTERALYAKVNADGKVEVVNTLGLNDGGDVCGFLEKAGEAGSISLDDLDPTCEKVCSWPKYSETVRELTSDVARYNADTTGLECCRSEGKTMILASIHDTYPNPKAAQLVWVSTKDFATAHELKREVALCGADTMAKQCEYMNKETYDGVDQAGRILIFMIRLIGMQRLEPLWNLKLWIETIPLPYTNIICDKFLWWFNGIIPDPLPAPLRAFGNEFEHHLLVEFGEYSDGEIDRLTKALEKFVQSKPEGTVKYHVCAPGTETAKATYYRFVVAPAFRTFAVGKGLQGLSIDYALPKNYVKYPDLPEKKYPIANRWIYSHFGCNVYHEDLTFGPEVDVEHGKYEVKHAIEDTGGKLPAEHGHGTEYPTSQAMKERWMKTDPLNVMNPGVGHTSPMRKYAAFGMKSKQMSDIPAAQVSANTA